MRISLRQILSAAALLGLWVSLVNNPGTLPSEAAEPSPSPTASPTVTASPAPTAPPAAVTTPVPSPTPAPPTPTPAPPTPTPTPAPIYVSSNSPVPLLVNGLVPEKVPATVMPGSQVCVSETTHYPGTTERWTFETWSNGATEPCLHVEGPGTYRALFGHEVVLTVKSTVTDLQESKWVTHGSPVAVEVPAIVEQEPGVRYRFQEWSDGDAPFRPGNTIAPLKPTILEAKWTKEYQVQVDGATEVAVLGSGWYPDGTNLVLQAPELVRLPNGVERLKFAAWRSVGLPFLVVANAQQAITTVKVDAPYSLRATYEKEYWVVAQTPVGTLKRDWMKEGAELPLETPPVIEVVPEQERLVFKKWDGMEGLTSPKVTGIISSAVSLQAVYDRQVKVTVNAPYGGSGDGWYAPGATVTVAVARSQQKLLVMRDSFAGFPGYSSVEPSFQLIVREPTTITALYRTDVDVGVLAVLLLLPLGITLLYFGFRLARLWLRQRTAAPGPVKKDWEVVLMPKLGPGEEE